MRSRAAGPIGTKQAAVLAKTEAEMTQASLTFDAACVGNLIAQLSDEDADLILSAVPPGSANRRPGLRPARQPARAASVSVQEH